jgi:hypothetical protein
MLLLLGKNRSDAAAGIFNGTGTPMLMITASEWTGWKANRSAAQSTRPARNGTTPR